jgi:hypothetical protein
VGKADNPYKRYCNHLIDKSNNYRVHWIQELLKNGLLPIRQILEECDKSEWEKKEKDWIAFERRCGCKLVNNTDGGEGMKNPSEETRRKLSLSLKGRLVSEDTRRKLREKLKGVGFGRHLSEETKKKLSKKAKDRTPWNKGKTNVYSPETIERIRRANLEKHFSEATRKKLSESHKGRVLSKQHRQHIGEAHRGLPHYKMRGKIAWNRGIPASFEAKRKNSDAHKGKISWNKGLRNDH